MNRDDATLLAQDAETRRQAQIEFHRPLVLEAGAGTGKTPTLVARVLAWILGTGWDRAVERSPEADVDGPVPTSLTLPEGLVALYETVRFADTGVSQDAVIEPRELCPRFLTQAPGFQHPDRPGQPADRAKRKISYNDFAW